MDLHRDGHARTERDLLDSLPPLAGGVIHVWSLRLDGSLTVDESRALLSAEEVERASRFVTGELRRRFIIGRAALRRLLSVYTHAAPGTLAFELGPHGKPSLRDAGRLQFNMSHSGELAVAAVATDPVGIDVEELREVRGAAAIAARFFSEAEQTQYNALAPEDRTRAFFRCWTRKEAFIKATGEGLSRPLASFDVTLRADEPPRLTRIEGIAGSPADWTLHSFEPAAGFECALAIRRRGAAIRHVRLGAG